MNITDWLPTSKDEVEKRGWDGLDIIIFSGDAYVDHPSFAAAVIGRMFEAYNLRVAIVPQPNWRDDLRDFKKLGRPEMFFCVSPGAMDSMVNHYTANRRLRSDDSYTPGGKSGFRPDYPSIVYTKILKQLFPDVPVILGGIEASLRRFTHYDYWQNKLRPSILLDSGADLLVYGMGEMPLQEIVTLIKKGVPFSSLNNIRQVSFIQSADEELPKNKLWQTITLNSHEVCLKDKIKYAENFKFIEIESNKIEASRIVQQTGDKLVVVNPQYPPMTEKQIDFSFDLPYTRMPHPRYKGKEIPAYDMIRHSVNIHRGCFGGCAFCTISAHQGKFIASRSEKSILAEVKKVTQMSDFKGYISDLGGPGANMYGMRGKDFSLCEKCVRPSCLFPKVCKNLNTDHSRMLDLYKKVDALPGVKKSFIGSGIRLDLLINPDADEKEKESHRRYMEEVIVNHVSGRLKVAPEHTEDEVLNIMRKPSFSKFEKFSEIFDSINRKHNLNQQLIPYFISSHPGCTLIDMAQLAIKTRNEFHLEQVQDFTPTPMTLSTEIYYSGVHPYTLKPIFTAVDKNEKLNQKMFFFWYKPEEKSLIVNTLKSLNRPDLIKKILPEKFSADQKSDTDKNRLANSRLQSRNRNRDNRGFSNKKH